uniref:Vesicle transport protein n=1 Tax=Athene cunicularia TaxID=194338 RepID=A0A663LIL1_ATHCN
CGRGWLVLPGETPDKAGSRERVIDATSLGWGTRVKGFVACFAIGCLCSLLGSCLLWVPKKGLLIFAVFYTLGNIASIGRSGKGSENRSRPENSSFCRGIVLGYLAVHAEPLWLVFLKSRLKKHLSRMI